MKGDATEEKDEHGCPFYGFDDGPEEYFLAETVTQHGERERGEHVEDYGHADEDLPGGEVELIDVVVEPADHEVVSDGEGDGTCDGIVYNESQYCLVYEMVAGCATYKFLYMPRL